MRHANYTNDRWFMRTARTLPVVAVAALTGGAIGGFSVYAIILALTESPGTGAVALKTEATPTVDNRPQNAVSPIRTIGTPPPNVTEPPALPAQPPQQAQAAPGPQQTATSQTPTPQTPTPQTPTPQTPTPQAPWPDALSRAHPPPPQGGATAETPPPVSSPSAGSETVNAAQSKPVPPKPLPQKRRVVARKPSPAPYQSTPYQSYGETAARSQPVYDYYGGNRYGDAVDAPPQDLNRSSRVGSPPNAMANYGGKTRIVVRRQGRDGDYQADVPRQLPPQPAPPGLFGGGFGGGYRDDGWR
jgi:hypothetical protein